MFNFFSYTYFIFWPKTTLFIIDKDVPRIDPPYVSPILNLHHTLKWSFLNNKYYILCKKHPLLYGVGGGGGFDPHTEMFTDNRKTESCVGVN